MQIDRTVVGSGEATDTTTENKTINIERLHSSDGIGDKWKRWVGWESDVWRGIYV